MLIPIIFRLALFCPGAPRVAHSSEELRGQLQLLSRQAAHCSHEVRCGFDLYISAKAYDPQH